MIRYLTLCHSHLLMPSPVVALVLNIIFGFSLCSCEYHILCFVDLLSNCIISLASATIELLHNCLFLIASRYTAQLSSISSQLSSAGRLQLSTHSRCNLMSRQSSCLLGIFNFMFYIDIMLFIDINDDSLLVLLQMFQSLHDLFLPRYLLFFSDSALCNMI